MMAADKVVIIGGGIGGLTAAAAIQKVGIEVKVFERAGELREVGAGITLWCNAMSALKRIELDKMMSQSGADCNNFEFRSSSGTLLGGVDIKSIAMKTGVPSVCITRSALLHNIASAVDPDSIKTGHQFVAYEQDEDSVTAIFSNGHREKADLLIGADGLHSAVRHRMIGNMHPLRYAGYTTWRGIADVPSSVFPIGTVVSYHGRGSQLGLLSVAPGKVCWYGTMNTSPSTPRDLENESGEKRKQQVLARFGDWAEPIPTILEATPESAFLRNDIYDREPGWMWSKDRLTLLGDAAHPTTPTLGQGACQAIEDGVEIARCLKETRTIKEALKEYERARMVHTASITKKSRDDGAIAQWENPMACRIRDALMKAQLSVGAPPGFTYVLSNNANRPPL